MSKSIITLIDGETVSPACAGRIFSYAASLGAPAAREIYGSGSALNAWTDAILEHTVSAVFTMEGNASCAMVIGAVELLHALPEGEDGTVFLLVTDADLSALAVHLRKRGMEVIGMGNRENTRSLWVKACTAFESLELPAPAEPARPVSPNGGENGESPTQAEEKNSAEIPQAATNHRVRLALIRQIISGQIAENGGRVRSRDLFRVLSADPNYQLDQKKSRRNPLDYLRTQFDPWFNFEQGEKGTCWITERHAAGARAAEEIPAETADPVPDALPAEDRSPAPAEEAPHEPAPAFSLPVPLDAKDISSEILTNLGIPLIHADRAAELLSGCRNMRGVYNALRRAFGNEPGKTYYEILKAVPLTFPEREPAAKEEDDSARPLTREEIHELMGDRPIRKAEDSRAPAPAPEVENAPEDPADKEAEDNAGEDDTLRLSSGPVRHLLERGVTSDKAVRIVKIFYESQNQRIAYNELRKAFGNKGSQYLKMMKEYGGENG